MRAVLREVGHDARIFASSVGDRNLRQADFECWGSNNRFTNRLLQTCNPIAAIKLSKVLKSFRPDVVHLNTFLTQLSPLILRVLKDVPVAYTEHYYRSVCPLGTKLLPDKTTCTYPAGIACLRNKCLPFHLWSIDMLQLWLLRKYQKYINIVLAITENTRGYISANSLPPVKTLYNFVDIPTNMNSAQAKEPTICFVGQLVPVKGVDVLLHAMRKVVDRIPKAKLLIAGDGKEKESLRELIKKLNLSSSVELLGYVPNSELDDKVWNQAWVQAVPSIWAEPFGLVAIEAMAREIPVIASLSGGLEEIVEDSASGFLVEPGDVDQLAEKLCRILANKELATSMGKNGRAIVKSRFNKDKHIEKLVTIYKSVAGNQIQEKR